MNLTEQPPTVPERFKEGCYLGFKGCVVDAEERGDHNTLGLRFIWWMGGKIYTIYYFWYATRGVHCGIT